MADQLSSDACLQRSSNKQTTLVLPLSEPATPTAIRKRHIEAVTTPTQFHFPLAMNARSDESLPLKKRAMRHHMTFDNTAAAAEDSMIATAGSQLLPVTAGPAVNQLHSAHNDSGHAIHASCISFSFDDGDDTAGIVNDEMDEVLQNSSRLHMISGNESGITGTTDWSFSEPDSVTSHYDMLNSVAGGVNAAAAEHERNLMRLLDDQQHHSNGVGSGFRNASAVGSVCMHALTPLQPVVSVKEEEEAHKYFDSACFLLPRQSSSRFPTSLGNDFVTGTLLSPATPSTSTVMFGDTAPFVYNTGMYATPTSMTAYSSSGGGARRMAVPRKFCDPFTPQSDTDFSTHITNATCTGISPTIQQQILFGTPDTAEQSMRPRGCMQQQQSANFFSPESVRVGAVLEALNLNMATSPQNDTDNAYRCMLSRFPGAPVAARQSKLRRDKESTNKIHQKRKRAIKRRPSVTEQQPAALPSSQVDLVTGLPLVLEQDAVLKTKPKRKYTSRRPSVAAETAEALSKTLCINSEQADVQKRGHRPRCSTATAASLGSGLRRKPKNSQQNLTDNSQQVTSTAKGRIRVENCCIPPEPTSTTQIAASPNTVPVDAKLVLRNFLQSNQHHTSHVDKANNVPGDKVITKEPVGLASNNTVAAAKVRKTTIAGGTHPLVRSKQLVTVRFVRNLSCSFKDASKTPLQRQLWFAGSTNEKLNGSSANKLHRKSQAADNLSSHAAALLLLQAAKHVEAEACSVNNDSSSSAFSSALMESSNLTTSTASSPSTLTIDDSIPVACNVKNENMRTANDAATKTDDQCVDKKRVILTGSAKFNVDGKPSSDCLTRCDVDINDADIQRRRQLESKNNTNTLSAEDEEVADNNKAAALSHETSVFLFATDNSGIITEELRRTLVLGKTLRNMNLSACKLSSLTS